MDNRILDCKDRVHRLSVCSVDGRKRREDGYFFGVCLTCGETFEVRYKQLEEAFKDGRDE